MKKKLLWKSMIWLFAVCMMVMTYAAPVKAETFTAGNVEGLYPNTEEYSPYLVYGMEQPNLQEMPVYVIMEDGWYQVYLETDYARELGITTKILTESGKPATLDSKGHYPIGKYNVQVSAKNGSISVMLPLEVISMETALVGEIKAGESINLRGTVYWGYEQGEQLAPNWLKFTVTEKGYYEFVYDARSAHRVSLFTSSGERIYDGSNVYLGCQIDTPGVYYLRQQSSYPNDMTVLFTAAKKLRPAKAELYAVPGDGIWVYKSRNTDPYLREIPGIKLKITFENGTYKVVDFTDPLVQQCGIEQQVEDFLWFEQPAGDYKIRLTSTNQVTMNCDVPIHVYDDAVSCPLIEISPDKPLTYYPDGKNAKVQIKTPGVYKLTMDNNQYFALSDDKGDIYDYWEFNSNEGYYVVVQEPVTFWVDRNYEGCTMRLEPQNVIKVSTGKTVQLKGGQDYGTINWFEIDITEAGTYRLHNDEYYELVKRDAWHDTGEYPCTNAVFIFDKPGKYYYHSQNFWEDSTLTMTREKDIDRVEAVPLQKKIFYGKLLEPSFFSREPVFDVYYKDGTVKRVEYGTESWDYCFHCARSTPISNSGSVEDYDNEIPGEYWIEWSTNCLPGVKTMIPFELRSLDEVTYELNPGEELRLPESTRGEDVYIRLNIPKMGTYRCIAESLSDPFGWISWTEDRTYYEPGVDYYVLADNQNELFKFELNVDDEPGPELNTQNQLVSTAATEGDWAEIYVQAWGLDLTYQWQYRPAGAANWKNVTDNSNQENYRFIADMSLNNCLYRCVVTDRNGKSVISQEITLYVRERTLPAPAIYSLQNTAQGVLIRWSSLLGAAQYRVFYKAAGGAWTGYKNTTDSEMEVTGLTPGETYSFTVRCVSADGKTYTSPYDTVGKSIVYRPTDVTLYSPIISSLSNNAAGVQVTWGAVSGAAQYRVFYKTATGAWSTFGTVKGTSTTVTGLTSGTTYSFLVRCLSADEKSYTDTYDATKSKSITYIAQPAVSSLSNAANGVQVKWNAVPGAAQYRVFYKAAGGSWTGFNNTTGTNLTVTGLTAGTTYSFTVRCVSADGKSYTSTYDTTGKSIVYQPVVTKLAKPEISSLNSNATGVQVTWGAVSGAAQYRVFYKTATGAWTAFGDVKGTGTTVTGLTSGTTYTFLVRCLSADAKAYTSDYDATKSKSHTYIAQPAVSSVSNTANGVEVKWNAIGGAAQYRVFFKAAGGSWTGFNNTTGNSLVVTGLTAGTTYSFTVRCVSADGKSYTSTYDTTGKSIVYQPAASTMLAKPEITALNSNSTGVQVSWGAVSGAAQYRVFYKTATGAWTTFGNVKGTSATVTGLTSGTTYTFLVRCLSADGKAYTSDYDAAKSKSHIYIAQPAVSSVTNTSAGGVEVKWNAVGGASQYRVFYKAAGGSWTGYKNTTGTSMTVTGLTASTTYSFTVRCVSADGKSYTSTYDTTGKSIAVK